MGTAYGTPAAPVQGERPRIPALVFTTAAVIAGFGVLALSEFTLIRNFGLVTSGLVFLCLLADLTLLPPLLLSVDRKSL